VYPRWFIIYVGCCDQLSICRFDGGLTKNPISALKKWKTHFSWDETKIGLCGIPRHPKDHVRVLYGLISTIYAMIRAKPRLFDLKASNLDRGRSDALINCFYPGLNFFPHLGDIK
jgi:hypothetical protein